MRGRSLSARVLTVLSVPAHRRTLRVRLLLGLLRRACPDLTMVAVDSPDGITILHAADSTITPIYMGYGVFQHAELDKAIRWTAEIGRSVSGVLLDVGANVGTTALDALRAGPFERAVCIEPAPDNLRVLRLNVMANGLQDRCIVLPVACSAEPGTARLLVSAHNMGDHRIGDEGDRIPPGHARSIKVETLPLDGAVARAGVAVADVSLVWIDTQGHEAHVLAGASEVLAGGAPVCLELWPEEHRRVGALEVLLDQIEQRFESFTDLRSDTLDLQEICRVRDLVASLGSEQTDLFLVPRSAGPR